MSRIALLLIIAVGIISGLVLGLYPELDLKIAGLFFDPETGRFPAREDVSLSEVRFWSMIVLSPFAVVGGFSLLGKLLFPSRPMKFPPKAAMFLLITLAVGPGLLMNVILKPHSGRPRPIDVVDFKGQHPFYPWYNFKGPCTKNCSFASGEASGGFWAIAPAVLAPPQYRYAAIGAGLAYGVGVGVLRMAFGSHFLSDVIFAGVLVSLIIWLTHGYYFRWGNRNVSEAEAENKVAAFAFSIRAFFGKGRKKAADSGQSASAAGISKLQPSEPAPVSEQK